MMAFLFPSCLAWASMATGRRAKGKFARDEGVHRNFSNIDQVIGYFYMPRGGVEAAGNSQAVVVHALASIVILVPGLQPPKRLYAFAACWYAWRCGLIRHANSHSKEVLP